MMSKLLTSFKEKEALTSSLPSSSQRHSLNVSNLPIFALFLDAKSAFDRVLKEILVRNLFTAGTDDHRLLYIDKRLKNRRTFCEYDKQIMGPSWTPSRKSPSTGIESSLRMLTFHLLPISNRGSSHFHLLIRSSLLWMEIHIKQKLREFRVCLFLGGIEQKNCADSGRRTRKASVFLTPARIFSS